MSEPRYPGATWDPGVSAGYQHGKVGRVVSVVAHFTVGVDSRALLRDQGLCEFLISRDGTVWQFAEADAVCWQAGDPYNHRGPGIEIEWYEPHDGPNIFTNPQRAACADLVQWLHHEWGVPLTYKDDDPRVADWVGFIAHRSVVEDADNHTDYWPRDDWDRMVAPAPAPTPAPPAPEDDDMAFTATDENNETWLFGGVERHKISWDQANYLTTLAQPIKYQGQITNVGRDAFKDVG